jgi:hypothetical protein
MANLWNQKGASILSFVTGEYCFMKNTVNIF